MNKMSEIEQKGILEILKEKKAIAACPRCEHYNFYLLEYSSEIKLSREIYIPVITLSCKGCGFIIQHALKTLEMETKNETK